MGHCQYPFCASPPPAWLSRRLHLLQSVSTTFGKEPKYGKSVIDFNNELQGTLATTLETEGEQGIFAIWPEPRAST
jgi:hypothetical protein